jgi:hypothetical protein
MNIPIFCESNSKPVGRFDTNSKVHTRRLYGSRHMLRKPRAVAFDAEIVAQLQRLGCQFLEVFDRETGITYRAGFPEFLAKKISINRGFGQQEALPLRYWDSSGGEWKASEPTAAKEREAPKPEIVQLHLFGSVNE